MDWITDEVAIGNYLEAQDTALLRASRFRSVLSLDGTLTPGQAADLGVEEVVVIRLLDGPGNDLFTFRRAVAAVTELVENRSPVLVQCHAGRSRSAVVVAGYLVRALGLDPEEALAQVSARREICVTRGLEELLDRL
jgi:protein-tyrosine phosphatase